MKLDEKILFSIRQYFKDKPVLKVYLFGSYSKNEAYEDSDIDLLLDLDYENNIGLGFIKMKLDLEEILKIRVDLVSSNGLSKFVKPYIDQEKKLIYAK
jgi:uncharacterized protein